MNSITKVIYPKIKNAKYFDTKFPRTTVVVYVFMQIMVDSIGRVLLSLSLVDTTLFYFPFVAILILPAVSRSKGSNKMFILNFCSVIVVHRIFLLKMIHIMQLEF